MADQFETDPFALKCKAIEFLEAEVQARIKKFDSCVMIAGEKVAATVEFKDGCVHIDVETPVKYI